MVIARPMGFGTGIAVDFRHHNITRRCNLANYPRDRLRQPQTVELARPCLFVESTLLAWRAPGGSQQSGNEFRHLSTDC